MAVTTTATTATWGTDKNDIGSITGIVQSFERTESLVETEPIRDNKGTIVHHIYYDKKITATATVVCKNDQAFPTEETQISIDGESFYIVNMNKVSSNRDTTKFNITLESYTNCNQLSKEFD